MVEENPIAEGIRIALEGAPNSRPLGMLTSEEIAALHDDARETSAEVKRILMDVEIDYTNHHGERRWRRITPTRLTWGLSEWHPGCQWILLAHCHEKNAPREFAMTGIHAWRNPT